ncbi:MAG: two-component system sensor histidine kinase NtrB [Desulfobacterales bacterium]
MKQSTQTIEEKVKPFRLVKYFTFSSLAVLFAGALVLSLLNVHWARRMQLDKNKDYALLLIENLNHQVFLQFVLPTIIKHGKIQLREKEQYELMDQVIRTTLHGFKVDQVNIYDLNNTISYSTDTDLIGRRNAGGTHYMSALKGERVTKLDQQGSFTQLLIGIPSESRIVTYSPLRAEKPLSRFPGPVLGVVEIVQDLSDEYEAIYHFQVQVILTCTAVMVVLFLFLLVVVRRGERIIERRALERLRLEEQLSKAKHLSSLGEMTAAISHEIRNPLGIIKSSADLLKKRIASLDPSNQIPEIIVEEAGRLNNIITDFLNYARPREPRFKPCRLQEVIQKNLSYLGPQIEDQGYRVEKILGNGIPEIEGDPEMLYQAFLNVLINAMQAMPGGGQIRVEIHQLKKAVRIAFQDHGPGIPDDLKEKIWDPFFTNKEKGTGLGLGIVRNIVEAHGGVIRIDNSKAGGARVEIDLPIRQEL